MVQKKRKEKVGLFGRRYHLHWWWSHKVESDLFTVWSTLSDVRLKTEEKWSNFARDVATHLGWVRGQLHFATDIFSPLFGQQCHLHWWWSYKVESDLFTVWSTLSNVKLKTEEKWSNFVRDVATHLSWVRGHTQTLL